MKIQKYRKEVLLCIDLCIMIITSFVMYLMLPRTNQFNRTDIKFILPTVLLMLFCNLILPYLIKLSNNSIWRYADTKDYLLMLRDAFFSIIFFWIINNFIFQYDISKLYYIATYSVSLHSMLFIRFFYQEYRNLSRKKKVVNNTLIVIVGAGSAGVHLQKEIEKNSKGNYQTLFFLDDSLEKIGRTIHGIEVKGPISNMDYYLKNQRIGEIIVAMPSISVNKLNDILKMGIKLKCKVRVLPHMYDLLQDKRCEFLWNSVKDVWLEELLGRELIELKEKEVQLFIENKVVMVSGGGGTIGSGLCRQIAHYGPKQLVIIDIYENNAYEIQQELERLYKGNLNLQVEIASIRDSVKVKQLFQRYQPDIVFHAAAHKHVPLMEHCPEEAIKNNIFGTYHMVLAAHEYNTKKFVLISTDKAVNPTSVMGATKRFCEMIIQSMKDISKTEYVAVRFGNVIGSNGSVIPLFQNQIAKGGPVTITDKRIERYFMTISEAVQLVLQAGAIANQAEIYVLDMGKPVKILELAENLILMNGRLPYVEIPIVETGLRPGEKLYEELLTNSEELIATQKHKIFIEYQIETTKKEVEDKLKLLQEALDQEMTTANMKEVLKSVVSTYHEEVIKKVDITD